MQLSRRRTAFRQTVYFRNGEASTVTSSPRMYFSPFQADTSGIGRRRRRRFSRPRQPRWHQPGPRQRERRTDRIPGRPPPAEHVRTDLQCPPSAGDPGYPEILNSAAKGSGRQAVPYVLSRLVNLLLHLPASVIDRRARPKIRDAAVGTVVTLEVTIDRHRPPPPRNSRAPYLVYASDDTGDVVLTYFRSPPGYVEKLLPVGAKRYVSGTLQTYDGVPQIVHPDRVVDEAAFAKLSGIDPIYPLTEGLPQRWMRSMMWQALEQFERFIVEPNPDLTLPDLPTRANAVHMLHFPEEILRKSHPADVERKIEIAVVQKISLETLPERRRSHE